MYGRLRSIRESKNFTQEYMSDQLGYKSKNAYSLKERGMRKFSVKEAQIISNILGMSVEDIFFDNEVNKLSTRT